MMQNWYLKHLLTIEDYSQDAVMEIIGLAARLKKAKKDGSETQYLKGKNIALIFEKTSTRTRCAFEVGAADQGAHTTYLGPGSSQLGDKESVADTAKVLGRMFDAIEYRGFAQTIVETLSKNAGVPVYNGLTDESHPTQMFADLLTMQEHSHKPLKNIRFAYLGDARFNTGNSLLITGALMGMDVRIAAPKALQPSEEIIAKARSLAAMSGAKITITEDAAVAIKDCDFVQTDIWVSMGEDKSVWDSRVPLLLPYRLDSKLMQASGNPEIKFMHCLPAFHNLDTPTGQQFYEQRGLKGIEVSEDVFASEASIVFDQAENRMHTIKAILVATLSDKI